ncbi:MAG TPA: hypothetical protein VGI10_11245 [Polyangiaceae bacterium]
MDIDEAAAIVAGPRTPAWGEAIQALGHYVRAQAKKARAHSDEADDIAQETLLKILPRLQCGDSVWSEGQHREYLKACAGNGVASLHRKSARATSALRDLHAQADALGLGVVLPPPIVDKDGDPREQDEPTRDLIEKIAQFARSRRKPRYQNEFDQAWSELQAIVYAETPLNTILVAKIGAETDKAAYLKARNNAYKAHERIRAELLAAVTALRETTELTSAEAELAIKALRTFVRCQRGAPPRVTPEKGPA